MNRNLFPTSRRPLVLRRHITISLIKKRTSNRQIYNAIGQSFKTTRHGLGEGRPEDERSWPGEKGRGKGEGRRRTDEKEREREEKKEESAKAAREAADLKTRTSDRSDGSAGGGGTSPRASAAGKRTDFSFLPIGRQNVGRIIPDLHRQWHIRPNGHRHGHPNRVWPEIQGGLRRSRFSDSTLPGNRPKYRYPAATTQSAAE